MMTFNYGNLALGNADINEGLKARGKQLQWLVIKPETTRMAGFVLEPENNTQMWNRYGCGGNVM